MSRKRNPCCDSSALAGLEQGFEPVEVLADLVRGGMLDHRAHDAADPAWICFRFDVEVGMAVTILEPVADREPNRA